MLVRMSLPHKPTCLSRHRADPKVASRKRNSSQARHTPSATTGAEPTIAPIGWSGVLFLHRGYYQGAILHFTLSIPPSYPSTAPTITFDSPIFHPLVDPSSGRMRLDWRFPTWRAREDCISHVLHAVKGAFKRKALEGLREALCANHEAFHLCVSRLPSSVSCQLSAIGFGDRRVD